MKIPRKTYKCEVPSVAMGDIAFNLLIFFVILAKSQDDGHVKWQPAKGVDLKNAGAAKVSVAIDNGGVIYLNGHEVGTVGLAEKIESFLKDAPVGERIVHLKADRDAQALLFEPVIEAIGEAGGDLVHVLEDDRKKK
jgi:biopolymer transport protein ExbD